MNDIPRNQYRVFISYSHDDGELVDKLESLLEESNVCPMRDKNFAFGCGFHEQIKTFIDHAHVFLPVITEASSSRGWVHQEIGYATAMNVPVVPVTVGTWAGQMLQTLHAVHITEAEAKGDLAPLKNVLTFDMFDNLVNRYRDSSFALYHTAEFTEDRAMMIANYANSVLALRRTGLVRQKGALSSFHIPCNVIPDRVWQDRYGQVHMAWFHKRVLREERLALDKHAKASGCRLIIDPDLKYPKFGPDARVVRLETLMYFLKEMTNDNTQVAVMSESHSSENILIVGDWFAAESVSTKEGHGYRQTVFTCHAPSMCSRIELFDKEFSELLTNMGWTAETSRESAIQYIQKILDELRPKNTEIPADG